MPAISYLFDYVKHHAHTAVHPYLTDRDRWCCTATDAFPGPQSLRCRISCRVCVVDLDDLLDGADRYSQKRFQVLRPLASVVDGFVASPTLPVRKLDSPG